MSSTGKTSYAIWRNCAGIDAKGRTSSNGEGELPPDEALVRILESWGPGEGPEEHQALWAQYDQEMDEKYAQVMREHGEYGMADLYLNNRDEFDRLCQF